MSRFSDWAGSPGDTSDKYLASLVHDTIGHAGRKGLGPDDMHERLTAACEQEGKQAVEQMLALLLEAMRLDGSPFAAPNGPWQSRASSILSTIINDGLYCTVKLLELERAAKRMREIALEDDEAADAGKKMQLDLIG